MLTHAPVTDFCLLCVPVIVIARVRMPLVRKLRLIAMFCLGAICCVTSTVRIVFIHRSSRDFTCKIPLSRPALPLPPTALMTSMAPMMSAHKS